MQARRSGANLPNSACWACPSSEADGGFGGGPVDTLIVMQALGRALAPVPYLATVVLCGALLRAAASPAQRAALVPAIAAGELTLAFAHSETQARYDLADVRTTARRQGDGWVLEGEKRFVLAGDSADQFIVSARAAPAGDGEDGIALFLVDARPSRPKPPRLRHAGPRPLRRLAVELGPSRRRRTPRRSQARRCRRSNKRWMPPSRRSAPKRSARCRMRRNSRSIT